MSVIGENLPNPMSGWEVDPDKLEIRPVWEMKLLQHFCVFYSGFALPTLDFCNRPKSHKVGCGSTPAEHPLSLNIQTVLELVPFGS